MWTMTWAGFGRLERLSAGCVLLVLHTRLRAFSIAEMGEVAVGEVGEVPLQKQLYLLRPGG